MMPASTNRRKRLTVVGAVLLVIAMSTLVAAAPGDLDTTFDGDGRVTTDLGTVWINGMAIQDDGKILAAAGGNTADFALTRYKTNGALDTTFGGGSGTVTTDFASRVDSAGAVAVQADGKIVVAGSASFSPAGTGFALARYNSDGSLDIAFDGDGKVTTDFSPVGAGADAVAIQGDGKIIAAGSASDSMGRGDFALARYNADGSLDLTFDEDGKVVTDFASGHDVSSAVAIQGDGKIVAGGTTLFSSPLNRFALARYNADGSLDTAFDGDGKVETAVGTDGSRGTALAIQRDGKIVAAGFSWNSGSDADVKDFALARYNADGSLDSSFDGDGQVTTDFAAGSDEANGVAIQVDGRIVAVGCDGGFCEDHPDDNFAVARYLTDGSLDTGFGGGDGKVSTDFSTGTDLATSVALQRDGKIVAAGLALMPSTGHDLALARYKVCRPTSRRTSIPC